MAMIQNPNFGLLTQLDHCQIHPAKERIKLEYKENTETNKKKVEQNCFLRKEPRFIRFYKKDTRVDCCRI
jgi:hypothetical protein